MAGDIALSLIVLGAVVYGVVWLLSQIDFSH
jgi:hypothetical protein